VRTTVWLAVLAVIAVGIPAMTAVVRAYRNSELKLSTDLKRVHVVLIGASIGQGWYLSEWPARAQASGFSAEAIAAWQFDKSEAVEETLMRPATKFRLTPTYLKSLFQPPPKANIVILKECSSYFPGNQDLYRASIRKWVRLLEAGGVQVILATIVPVTKARAASDPGKQESLLEFNRWLRAYAREHHIPLLDLEAALSEQAEVGAYLQNRFDLGDGSHLNASAYAVLDNALRTTLCGITQTAGCDAVSMRITGR
jgi:hypothetical protein